jgi:RHS repeat-associated protein
MKMRSHGPSTTCYLALLLTFGTSCGGLSGEAVRTRGYAVGQPASAVLVNTSSNAVGRLSESGNGLARTFHQYDVRGRSTSVQRVMDDWSYVYASTYGYPQNVVAAAGPGSVITASTFPDQEVVKYTFDTGDAQETITTTPPGGAAQSIVSRMVRNVRGQTTEVDYGNGAQQFHTYNDATDLRLYQIYVTLNGTQQEYTYGFDANGSVTSVADGLGYASANYGYDSLGRLTGGTWAYGYDHAGNLTSKEGAAQSYFPSGAGSVHPHAVSSAGGLNYTYDANGNLTSRSDGMAITWNAEDMPIQVVGGAATTPTQKYFLGESLWKKVQAGTTTYYLPSMRLENGVPHKYFGAFAERDVDGSLKFYQGDHLGSSTLVTDSSGQVVHRVSYKPFGEDRSTPLASFTPRYQFNGKEKEQDGSGFYDYGARLYNPATGRFLSADTHGGDGLNRYSYARNNPLRYTDPSGHDSEVYSVDDKGKVHLATTVLVSAKGPKPKALIFSDPHPFGFRLANWVDRFVTRFDAREEDAYFRRLGYDVTMTSDLRTFRGALTDRAVRAIAVNAHGSGQILWTGNGEEILTGDDLANHSLDILIANACDTSTDDSMHGLRGQKGVTVGHFVGVIGDSSLYTEFALALRISMAAHGDATRLVRYIDEDNKPLDYPLSHALDAIGDPFSALKQQLTTPSGPPAYPSPP